ncbi:hypothetical protein IWZ01DRAFT_487096 [Phyllosticta capitalensis]
MDPDLYQYYHSPIDINYSIPIAAIVLAEESHTNKSDSARDSLLQRDYYHKMLSSKGFQPLMRIGKLAAGALFWWRSKQTMITADPRNTALLPHEGDLESQKLRRACAANAAGRNNIETTGHPSSLKTLRNSGRSKALLNSLKRDESTPMGKLIPAVSAIKAGSLTAISSYRPSGANSTMVSCEVSPAGPDINVDSLSVRQGFGIPHQSFKESPDIICPTGGPFDGNNTALAKLSSFPEQSLATNKDVGLELDKQDFISAGVSLRDILKRSRGHFHRKSLGTDLDVLPKSFKERGVQDVSVPLKSHSLRYPILTMSTGDNWGFENGGIEGGFEIGSSMLAPGTAVAPIMAHARHVQLALKNIIACEEPPHWPTIPRFLGLPRMNGEIDSGGSENEEMMDTMLD